MKKEDKPLLEEAYLTGLLSLLDAGRAFSGSAGRSDQRTKLIVSQEISDAILFHKNTLGEILLLVHKTEKNEMSEIIRILKETDISLAEYNEISMECFCWAQSNGKNLCTE